MNTKRKIKSSFASKSFDVFNFVFLGVVAFICIAPFLFVISASLSPMSDITVRKFFLYPIHIDLSSYQYLFHNARLIRSLGVSAMITIIGTALSMTVTLMTAYVLSKRQLIGRKTLNALVVFTMLFSGGMIPTYLVVSKLNLTDTFWSLWLPGCVSAYNMILIRTSIAALPNELEEAATVDGCNYFQSFYKIVLPLIKPTIATFGLFYAVGYWNSYFDATIYLNDSTKWPIQVWLRQIVLLSSGGYGELADSQNVPPQSIGYAVIVFATVPILCIYPFVQKYFAKGMMVGSVKG